MLWVWVIAGAAVAGLVMLAAFAVWLWRKVVGVFGELETVASRLDGAFALLDQLDWSPLDDPSSRARSGDAYTG